MFGSEALEVAIGLAFLFLLMALICTAVKEWIEGIFKWRAMDLERALRNLLDDSSGEITARLFQHPMISALFQGRYDPSRLTSSAMTPGAGAKHVRLSSRRNLPSYIPAAHFATAFLDLVARGPIDDGTGGGDPTTHPPLSIAALRERAEALDSPFVRRAVLAAIDHSRGDLQQVAINIQRWFDGAMDRASGWYKRRTQAILFGIGFAAAAVLNVDALHVMQRLTSDKTFRAVVVNAAAQAESPASGASAPPGRRFDEARENIAALGMPVGWVKARDYGLSWVPLQRCSSAKAIAAGADSAGCTVDPGVYPWIPIGLGWLITAFAVMLGAPFWFDVLNKFMVIRSTVKPHEKSPEEGSEDRASKLGGKDASGGPVVSPGPSAPLPFAPAPDAARISTTSSPAITPAPAPSGESFAVNVWREGGANPKEIEL